jgi:outer membrane immunogenic protein
MRYLSIAGAAAVSAVAFTQIAAAADMPVKAPVAPVPAPIYSWTGFYVGVHAGWGWSSYTVAVTPSPAFVSASGYETNSFDQNSDGFIGGGQIGYNWQFAPNWVIGIEGDISGAGIRETTVARSPLVAFPLAAIIRILPSATLPGWQACADASATPLIVGSSM